MNPIDEAHLNLMWGIPKMDFHLLRNRDGFCADVETQAAYDRKIRAEQSLALVRSQLQSSSDFNLTDARIGALKKEEAELVLQIAEDNEIISAAGSDFY